MKEIKNILVIGAGTMGQGIATWFAQQNMKVVLTDIQEEFLQKAIERIHLLWDKLAKKQKFTPEQIKLFKDSLSHKLAPLYTDFDLIIEAVTENENIKKNIFKEIDKSVDLGSTHPIIASNTSSISISSLASSFKNINAQYFIGIHFFNPAPIMKLVELVIGENTSIQLAQELKSFFQAHQKIPVISKDSPGFIVNRINRNFFGEALYHLNDLDENRVKQIDQVYREVAGFKMGPFQLMDLIGVDVNLDVTRSVWEQFNRPPRFAPHPIQEKMVQEGRLGKKAAKGFYHYE